ncbi:uncharacterized protein LOC127291180 isoform X2 [Leptopilina boulardi]|uniref:uncharacterized protein LOC127291180 isoform X2 n=1 Tax=Leptopilina boulardi TaxID=63433 RepID=UPI0021F5D451|nr:uncharacterized protein LOC127291180 isoform X2 [Leptopilina boulardi]
MFSLKINKMSIRLNNLVVNNCRNRKEYVLNHRQMRTLIISTENNKKTVKHCLFANITSISSSNEFFNNKRTFCSNILPKDPDIFGDVGEKKYDLVELDEAEKNVEEFEENEAKPMGKYRRTPGQYSNMIKKHIENGDLSSAENVLKIIHNNRDKPTLYMYSLLIRAFAVQGNVKKCFRLYNKLKKRGMTPNNAVVTSLFNACSNSLDERSLEILHDFRSYLFEKKFTMNETHYNALIKAYSRHCLVEETFQLLDEMRDKNLRIDDITFNNLLHGAASQKETGLKYALVAWHVMKFRNIKPTTLTYNLLFRAIRDSKLGNLKVNDIIIPESEEGSKIIVTEGGRPDLLATPPVVRLLPQLQSEKFKHKRHKKYEIEEQESMQTTIDLNDVLKSNRLILFGGFDGLMKRMNDDGAIPNVKTFSLCLELIPNTKEAEEHLIRMARNRKIQLDTGFYNVLIKKRCFRFDYEDAKAVLAEMERDNCEPDIITWGIVALTCQCKEDGMALLNCLDNIELIESMMKQKVRPSDQIYHMLEKLKISAAEAIDGEWSITKDLDRFKIDYTKFKLRLEKLKKMFGHDKRVYELSEVN